MTVKAVKRAAGGVAILALLSTGLVFASGPASALQRQSNCQIIEINYNNAVIQRNYWANQANAAYRNGDSLYGNYAVDQMRSYENDRIGYAQDFLANNC